MTNDEKVILKELTTTAYGKMLDKFCEEKRQVYLGKLATVSPTDTVAIASLQASYKVYNTIMEELRRETK